MASGRHIFGYHAWYSAVTGGRGKGGITQRLGCGMSPSPESVAAAMWFLGKQMVDWRPAWEQLAPMIRSELGKNLAAGHGPDGERWPDIDAKYQKRKRAQGYARTALHRSYRLRRSLADPKNTRIGKMSMKAGTDVPYARALHFGFSGTSKAIARQYVGATGADGSAVEKMRSAAGARPRPFMGISQPMRDRSLEVMARHADQLMKQAIAKMNQGAPAGMEGAATSEHIVKAFRKSDASGQWQKGKKYL